MKVSRLIQSYVAADLGSDADRALIEERYWSLRRQVPIIYLLATINLSAMEAAATGHLSIGLNLPTLAVACALIRMWQWFGSRGGKIPSHETMIRRMRQTVYFACLLCLAVCARCLYLLQIGGPASQMAVMLFGGLTGIGVAYGLTALPAAARIPLLLIVGPISAAAALSHRSPFAGAAFALVVVAALTLRLLGAHSRHFSSVVRSRSAIALEQQRVEHARQEAVIAATTDFLTGLPNRRAFVAALDSALVQNQQSFAIAILDLDRFKAVNDTFGHGIGDQLLQEVATRLIDAVGSSGTVARLGGDEFGILLPEVQRSRDAEAIGGSILKRVNGPVLLQGREFTVAASCGITVSKKRDDQSPSRLMADADLALYEAKESPEAVAVFAISMEAQRRRRAQIERALQLPSFRDQLGIVFQPIFDLRSGSIVASEALAQWTDLELGPVGPSEFVPIAEQLNLIDEINSHLMRLAFESARHWPADVRVAFNLSAVQLCSAGSGRAVLRAMRSAGLSVDRLQVEVTETALLADFERARANLTELRQAGATIVLDDFGAGYASIGYLRELQFDQIKLDGGLVTAAQHSADGKRLLRAVIGLCEILGVSTVAEHVESEELLRLVTDLGCASAQGFWLERPLSPDALDSFLKTASASPFQRRAA